jgi:hypothetical protein
VQIHNGYIYKKAMKVPLTTARESFFYSEKIEDIPKAVLACTLFGNRYFAHWMTDDVTLFLAAQQLGKPIRTSQTLTTHQIQYSTLLDIYETQVTNARCQELILINDFGQNKFKRERYEYIRSKLKSLSPLQSVKGVMLLRGHSGVSRYLINENEVAQFLDNQGFTIIDPEKLSAKEIVSQTIGAKIGVGVEGSQLVHGLFTMEEQGGLLTLQPPYRFGNLFKDYTDCLGLRYSFVVGTQIANGFKIDIEELARTLDKLNSSLL